MKVLPLLCTGVSLAFGPALYAQDTDKGKAAAPAPAAEKEEALDQGSVKLDGVKKVDVGDAAPAAPQPNAPRQLTGMNLSPEQTKAFAAGLGEVSNFLRGVRLLEALEKVNELEATFGSNHFLENLRGAAFTKMKNYTRARVHFAKAADLAKNYPAEAFHPRFNLAELDFVEKKWDLARTSFQKLIDDPGKPGTGSDDLMKFKVFVCDLQQKKDAAAEKLLGTFDQYNVDSPAFYYARAAQFFIKDEKEKANEWLESARRIYPREINEVYNDSLVEMGWLETLQ